jgi:hypothetical protein
MRAGLGMMGRGAVGMAGAAALPLAAFALAEKAGSTIYAGAQDQAEVGQIAQSYMGPQMGAPGSRQGGQLGRHQIKSIVSMMSEIASDDVMSSMDDLKRLMDRAGQMGMLSGAGGVEGFKRNFKKIVEQTRSVAQIMGTTLDEAAPIVGQLTQMGMWSTSDIMGTATMMKAAGPQGAQAMGSTMQAGAQMSHAMGGRLGAGATMGREMFRNIQAAVQTGVLSENQLREFTGGTGGAEGQRMMATQMTGAIAQLSRSPGGQLTMAALGEQQDGRYTGRMDEELMKQFRAGELDIEDLRRMSRKKTNTRASKLSFSRYQNRLGQEFGASAGVEGATALMDIAINKAGLQGDGEDAQSIMMQKMYGMGERTAEGMLTLRKEMGTIKDRKTRQIQAQLEEQFNRVDERMNRSWAGTKDAISNAWDETWKPLRELGTDLAVSMGEASDDLANWFHGRVRKIPITQKERMRALRSGALTQNRQELTNKMKSMGFGDEQDQVRSGFTDHMRGKGLLEGTRDWVSSMGMVGDFGPRSAALLSAGGSFRTNAAKVWGEDRGREGEVGLGDVMGTAVFMRKEERDRVQLGMFKRATNATRSGLGLKSDDAKTQGKIEANMGKIKDAVAQVWRDPKTANMLRRIKESRPDQYEAALIGMVKNIPGAREAMEENKKLMPAPPQAAGERSGLGKGNDSRDLDIVAIAQGEMHRTDDELAIQFGEGLELPNFSDPEDVRRYEAEQVNKIADMADVSRGVVEELVGKGMMGDVQDYVRALQKGETPGESAFTKAGGAAATMRKALQEQVSTGTDMSDILLGRKSGDIIGDFGGMDKAISGLGYSRERKVMDQERERIKNLARRSEKFSKVRGLGADQVTGLNELIEAYGAADTGEGLSAAMDQAGALSTTLTSDRQRAAMAKTGGFGAQVASMSAVSSLKGGKAKDFLKQLEGVSGLAGFDVMGAMGEEGRAALKADLESDGGIDKSELAGFQEKMGELLKRMGPAQGTGAAADANTAQMEFLEAYQKATGVATEYQKTTEKAIQTLQASDPISLMKGLWPAGEAGQKG